MVVPSNGELVNNMVDSALKDMVQAIQVSFIQWVQRSFILKLIE